ncbi:MAG: SurA N-terminal domain-containing protein [Chloroflexota bacterium]
MNSMIVKRLVLTVTLLLLLSACRQNDASDPSEVVIIDETTGETADLPPTAPPAGTASPTPEPPTPTPEPPLAARVNGQPILLETYERELARHEQALTELELDKEEQAYREEVLQALIERELILQAASRDGIVITPEMVTARIEELRAAAGEAGNYEAWLEANQWTEAEFREALAQEMVTEAMVTAVTADVPQAVEQVRARYIQVDSAELAQSLLAEIEAGADFATLASLHSLDQITSPNGGDLDFFTRGSLLVPEVEEAAFALQPGETSDVIVANSNGQTVYYLVQTIERDPQRPLTDNMRYNLLQQRFETWLGQLWSQADIERFINTNNP